MRILVLTGLAAALLGAAGCGPKGPAKGAAPPPTRASLQADGQHRVKRALAMVEEIEQIRGLPSVAEPDAAPADEPAAKGKKGRAAKPAAAAAPAPAGMDASTVAELDRQLARARELKDAIIALREELGEVLEKTTDPVAGKDLDRAQVILTRMSEKIGDMRDCKNRAMELKPKEPEKEPAKKK
jgi:hypothetical protein